MKLWWRLLICDLYIFLLGFKLQMTSGFVLDPYSPTTHLQLHLHQHCALYDVKLSCTIMHKTNLSKLSQDPRTGLCGFYHPKTKICRLPCRFTFVAEAFCKSCGR
jgi:hypothetical protein